MWRANKALISLQQAALTQKSDFPGEYLNNFATACRSKAKDAQNQDFADISGENQRLSASENRVAMEN